MSKHALRCVSRKTDYLASDETSQDSNRKETEMTREDAIAIIERMQQFGIELMQKGHRIDALNVLHVLSSMPLVHQGVLDRVLDAQNAISAADDNN